MNDSPLKIPFERQQDRRRCGAAALSMVFRAFGNPASQDEIWPQVSTDQWSARTHLLARHAIERGLSAAVVQAKRPAVVLNRCHQAGLPAILNHRLNPKSSDGHYSVYLGQMNDQYILHDPYYGPGRMLTAKQLGELWDWQIISQEVSGNVLVALTDAPPPLEACPACGETSPATTECPQCSRSISLELAARLGCSNATCRARTWRRVFCPYCDYAIRGFADGELWKPTHPTASRPLIRFVVDWLQSLLEEISRRVPDASARASFESMAQTCAEIGPELEAALREQIQDLKAAQLILEKLDETAAAAGAKAAARLEDVRARHAASRKPRRQNSDHEEFEKDFGLLQTQLRRFKELSGQAATAAPLT